MDKGGVRSKVGGACGAMFWGQNVSWWHMPMTHHPHPRASWVSVPFPLHSSAAPARRPGWAAGRRWSTCGRTTGLQTPGRRLGRRRLCALRVCVWEGVQQADLQATPSGGKAPTNCMDDVCAFVACCVLYVVFGMWCA